jgi:protein phosphatase
MRAWSLTDQGRVRKQNQDACSYLQFELGDGTEILAAVVCDGMGGAKAGNIASEIAVETFMEELRKDFYAPSVTDVQMLCAVKTANRLIYEKAQSDPDYEGMGTTLVAAVTDGSHVTVANVGDSRCYLIRDRGIQQLTKDHSVVEDMVDRGEIERADAWKHPRRNYITRALGAEEQVECDLFFRDLEPGDVLLLCSDGLSGVVNPQELLFEVVYGGELETAAERMVNIALERGAPDNVTALILTADDPQSETL